MKRAISFPLIITRLTSLEQEKREEEMLFDKSGGSDLVIKFSSLITQPTYFRSQFSENPPTFFQNAQQRLPQVRSQLQYVCLFSSV
jgi:hypothetical protein